MKYLQYMLLSALLLGASLNVLITDHIWPLSGIFYLLPFKLLLIVSMLYVLVGFKNKFHRMSSLVIAITLTILLSISDSGFIESDSTPNLICWNVARNSTSSEDLAEFVYKHRAETYVFIEFDKNKESEAEKTNINSMLTDYDVHLLSGNMAIITKLGTKVEILDSLTDSYNNFNVVKCDNVVYVIVDIGSWPLYNRAIPFGMLDNLLTDYKVDIICGDFNTPYNSIFFNELENNYISGNTNESFGRETWPSCFPLVSLDHILILNKYTVKNYSAIKICKTDHYPIQLSYE